MRISDWSSYVCSSDLPVTLLQGEDGSHTAYFWVYLRDSRPSGDMSPPAVAFRFTTGRGGKHPAAHLAGYRGYLQADGDAGYNALSHDPKTNAPRGVIWGGQEGRASCGEILCKYVWTPAVGRTLKKQN